MHSHPSPHQLPGPATQRRRILLSCFACSPLWGSEPGVGWRWLVELSQRHDVVLVTHGYFRAHLEPALRSAPLPGLEVHYCEAYAFGAHPHRQLNSRLFYIGWQLRLRRLVRPLLKEKSFDLVHHLTWGTFRFPTFLGRLGVPLVMGPLGGGDRAPLRFYRGLPLRAQAFEWLRSVSLRLAQFDPLAQWGPRASTLVLCKTADTVAALPAQLRARAVIALEIGAPPVDLSSRVQRPTGQLPFRLLFAGTLTAVKGIALALAAVDQLLQSGYDVTLDIAGQGPLRAHLQNDMDRRGLGKRVRLLGMLERAELFDLYGRADLFVFPSLHDSSGNVVLESLSRGLPVLCLDLCGPKYYVNADCALVLPTADRSKAQLEKDLADAIAGLIQDRPRLQRMSEEAVRQATIQTWSARVETAYQMIGSHLGWTA